MQQYNSMYNGRSIKFTRNRLYIGTAFVPITADEEEELAYRIHLDSIGYEIGLFRAKRSLHDQQ